MNRRDAVQSASWDTDLPRAKFQRRGTSGCSTDSQHSDPFLRRRARPSDKDRWPIARQRAGADVSVGVRITRSPPDGIAVVSCDSPAKLQLVNRPHSTILLLMIVILNVSCSGVLTFFVVFYFIFLTAARWVVNNNSVYFILIDIKNNET